MTEVKGLLNYTIDNNIRLQEEEGKISNEEARNAI